MPGNKQRRSKLGDKTKVPASMSSASRSCSTAAPADDVNPAPGHGDATPPSASSSAVINRRDDPAKKVKRRGRKKRGPGSSPRPRCSSTGTPADENSAAGGHDAAAGGTPSASSPPGVPSTAPLLGSSGSTGTPVDENSATGQHDAAAAAAAAASSASAASAAQSPKKTAKKRKPRGKKGGVTSAASSPVPAIKDDPSVALAASPKKPVDGGTLLLTSTHIEVVEHHRCSVVSTSPASPTLSHHAANSTSTYLHGRGRQQLKAAQAAITSCATLGDHAVSKIGEMEAMVVFSELEKYLSGSIDFELQRRFLKFLMEYTIQGELYPFYRARVLSLIPRKCYILEVDFDHLKRCFFENTKEYSGLVFKIVNNPDSTQSWLQIVAFIFLKSVVKSQGSFDGDEEIIKRNAKVYFTNKPQSIIMLEDALKDRPAVVRKLDVLHKELTMNALTAYGRSTFLAVLTELLNRHRKEDSYNGKFEIGDIVIVNSELCWILVTPSQKSTRINMKSDLGKLWTIMEQYYSNEGHLPLFFAELRDDLVKERLSNVTMEWFRLHLEYHPALMPSMGRRDMIYELHSVIQVNKSFMDEAFTLFLEKEPFESKDWRDKVKKGPSQIMLTVYTFWPPRLKQDPLAKTGSSLDHFANTWEGLLWYIRHFLMHANQTAKVVDTDEVELFAASKFPTLLPRLLKRVLSNREIQPYFAGALSSYRTSRSDPKDLPS